MGGVKVIGRSDGVLNGGDPKGDDANPPLEIPMMSASASTPDPSVGEECLQADMSRAIGADASSLDLKAARILSEAVVSTWEVHQLREILPITSRVSGYSKKPVTQKRLSHAYFIIKILA
jgi:hypothetical protein